MHCSLLGTRLALAGSRSRFPSKLNIVHPRLQPRPVVAPKAPPVPAVLPRRLASVISARSTPAQQQPKPQGESVWSALVSRIVKGVGIFALSAALLLAAVTPAHAARSGGRMGGSAFSGRSSFSTPASSFGRSSALGGSFGGSAFGGSSARSATALHHRPSVTTNAFFFAPFGMGYGYGGGITSLLFWGVFAVIMLQTLRGVLDQNGSSEQLMSGEKLSVAKVQVGLLGSARDLQRDLERIAARSDTSSSRGLHYVLQETVLALMRNPDYCVYGFAKSGVERSPDDAEARFNKLSLEERGKFMKETRVNVGGRTSLGSLGLKKSVATPVSELIVVTILLAAEGRLKLPRVTSRAELKEALTTLGSVPAEDVLAVEVLWTPEEENDYFTQDDLAVDYPLLNTL